MWMPHGNPSPNGCISITAPSSPAPKTSREIAWAATPGSLLWNSFLELAVQTRLEEKQYQWTYYCGRRKINQCLNWKQSIVCNYQMTEETRESSPFPGKSPWCPKAEQSILKPYTHNQQNPTQQLALKNLGIHHASVWVFVCVRTITEEKETIDLRVRGEHGKG